MMPQQEQLIGYFAEKLGMTHEDIQDVAENLFAVVGDWKDLSVKDGSLLINELLRINRSEGF